MASLSGTLPDGFVADSSLLVGISSGVLLARRFAPILKFGVVNAAIMAETFAVIERRSGVKPDVVEQTFITLGLRIEPFTIEMARQITYLKAVDQKRENEQLQAGIQPPDVKTLSLGDLCCLSQAYCREIPVVTGDMHWFSLIRHGLSVDLYDFRDRSVTP